METTNQIIYCGNPVTVNPANKGNVHVKSPIFEQTMTPGVFLNNAHIVERGTNRKYAIILNDNGECRKGVRI